MIDRLKNAIAQWLVGDLIHKRVQALRLQVCEQDESFFKGSSEQIAALRSDLALLSMKQRALAEQVQPVNPKSRAAWMKRLEARVNAFIEAHNARVTAAREAADVEDAAG